jgi:hypothetical protein
MNWKDKIINELKSVGMATLYFLVWFGILMIIKVLLLQEYQIKFSGLSLVIVGALVVAKVILIMEHIPLGKWVQRKPAIVNMLLRTILYSIGIVIILILEKAFEGRHEYGGFVNSLQQVFNNVDIYHVWVNSIAVFCALLSFNFLTLIRTRLGKGVLLRMLKEPPMLESK